MKIAVIGGGAAGLMAAGSAKGCSVTVFDHMEKVGKKIYITGKGRCNFTNVCDNQTFLQNVVTNSPFLRSAISKFTPYDAIDLLENNGCKTKVERGRRAFPQSDKASDVIKALSRYAENNGAVIKLNAKVKDIVRTDDGYTVISANGEERFDRIVLCTGGMSYPQTGSDGSAYAIVKRLGHNVIAPMPSLVALLTKEDLSAAEGLTLKNVSVRTQSVKPIFGDLMITGGGISGPIALTLSAYVARDKFPYRIYIDFKPALTHEELDARLLRDFGTQLNKQFKNALDLLLPKSVIPFIIEKSGVDGSLPVNSVTKKQRARIVEVIKSFELTIIGNEGFNRAVVTNGGVDVKEVNPKTMESRISRGLYFGGEVLNVDALTGGYNFHIALATGYVAGVSVAEEDNG
ncbi:MAG: NAD(P)/FAD-dependent oxidoreductase [Clostridiales bacterium]|nr:NAD(P)/FAD-dependent oxidoreductase [Clostridiales bacterium]